MAFIIRRGYVFSCHYFPFLDVIDQNIGVRRQSLTFKPGQQLEKHRVTELDDLP